MKTIRCRKCNKPTLEHQFDRQPNGNLIKICPLCILEKTKANKAKDKKQMLKSRGLTDEEYKQMFDKQNGRCAICSRESLERALALDHNHKTGENRALLCSSCNTALGLFQDNPQFLKRAVAYLYKYGSYHE